MWLHFYEASFSICRWASTCKSDFSNFFCADGIHINGNELCWKYTFLNSLWNAQMHFSKPFKYLIILFDFADMQIRQLGQRFCRLSFMTSRSSYFQEFTENAEACLDASRLHIYFCQVNITFVMAFFPISTLTSISRLCLQEPTALLYFLEFMISEPDIIQASCFSPFIIGVAAGNQSLLIIFQCINILRWYQNRWSRWYW